MYQYKFEQYNGPKSRYTCPQCNKARKYTRYIDILTGEYLPFEYGKCERLNNCGYWLNPYTDGFTRKAVVEGGKASRSAKLRKPRAIIKEKQCSQIPDDVFIKSQQYYERNYFLKYLQRIFETEAVLKLLQTYFIGTSAHWPGATVFWQVDKQGKIRTGKIMLYDPITGGRVKKPFDHITWVHKVLKLDDYVLEQCFFGEHLLSLHPEKPVAVVESEKTAIIASIYLPQFNWLASGSQKNLSVERCMPLKGRRVFLFPDLGAYQDWSRVAENCSEIGDFKVVDLLERIATDHDKQKGLDIADYLVRFSVQQFQVNENAAESDTYCQEDSTGKAAIVNNGYPASWDINYEDYV
ncbi:hypothetical protein D770_10060 [Flammeovirgaceae bacterium 311]|nr:hypothetical protein D770_10060 [Flammeovirgaceae bacterium 311]